MNVHFLLFLTMGGSEQWLPIPEFTEIMGGYYADTGKAGILLELYYSLDQ